MSAFSLFCIAVHASKSYDGPIPHKKNPTKCLKDSQFQKSVLNYSRPKGKIHKAEEEC